MPKLSIGIPVFNGQEFLPELLDSLLGQTFKDFEILICDNTSSDRTPQICREYERHDSRIHYIRNARNLGAIANFNRVFELSTAPLFKWAAHDDLCAATFLARCVDALDADPSAALAYSRVAVIDENGRLVLDDGHGKPAGCSGRDLPLLHDHATPRSLDSPHPHWRYHSVLVAGVPQFRPDLLESMRRFTWLVDEFYDRQVKLIVSAEAPVELLYSEVPGRTDTERTRSRLIEMQTAQYLSLPHLA